MTRTTATTMMHHRALIAALSIFVARSGAAPLPRLSPDLPVVADAVQRLTGAATSQWSVSSTTWGIEVPATVPGDLISDLQAAGVIGDPWFELGFLNSTTPRAQGAPLWDVGTWVYRTTFSPSPAVLAIATAGGAITIVCDGVKMAADLALDGVALGFVNDQFLRFTFPVSSPLSSNATLTLTFTTSRDVRNAEVRMEREKYAVRYSPT